MTLTSHSISLVPCNNRTMLLVLFISHTNHTMPPMPLISHESRTLPFVSHTNHAMLLIPLLFLVPIRAGL